MLKSRWPEFFLPFSSGDVLRGPVSRLLNNVVVFGLLVIFVLAVSVHDSMLVILHEPVIADYEQNPMGRWLIEVNGGGVWLFVITKLLGTAFVGAVVVVIYEQTRRAAMTIATALAVFQAGLLAYLSLH